MTSQVQQARAFVVAGLIAAVVAVSIGVVGVVREWRPVAAALPILGVSSLTETAPVSSSAGAVLFVDANGNRVSR